MRQRGDAEAIVVALTARIDNRDGCEAHAFEIRRIWIDAEDRDAVVKTIYRQRDEAWSGFAKRDHFPWVHGDRLLTPTQVADDIYDFVLVEPTEPPTWLPPDVDGVHLWPESRRPIIGQEWVPLLGAVRHVPDDRMGG